MKSDYFDFFVGYSTRSVFTTKPYKLHREKRKLISSFYQASNIYKLPEIEEHIVDCAHAVLGHIRSGEDVDAYQLVAWYAIDNITHLVLGPQHRTRALHYDCPERRLLKELKKLQFAGPIHYNYPMFFEALSQTMGRLNPRMSYLQAQKKLEHWCRDRITAAANDPLLFDSRSPVLDACLREIYRLHPAASGRDERVVPKGGCTLSGVHLPEGTIAMSSVMSLHRDIEVFPDPETFLPE
ncbi:Cytochrome P450 monooxygenase FGM1 [Cladobotryum mycophilum]|uniref:Cytochrome P450 monooxygenase FGM1 n=1 Tax=Cladobotryum mycophilum TaxID=491253 RepID=A0ABR0SIH5_9HYPO